ncbi:MAG: hypothetical protein V3V15_01850 [Sphingorhabdus sp.]
MTPVEKEQRAFGRFQILNISRFVAVGFVMAGAANIVGKFMPEYSPILGYTLLVIGVVDFFLMPVALKKMWAQQAGDEQK